MSMTNRLGNSNWPSRNLLKVFALSLLAMPIAARAENNCPWMNEATASDLVGGDAIGMYIAEKDKPAVCTFTEQSGKAIRTLQISVEVASDPHQRFLSTAKEGCGSNSPLPLQATGNEAVICAVDSHRKIVGQRAFGRVRDQIFTITLSTSIKDDPTLTPAMLKMKIDTAAEQVSGNLY